MLLILRVDPLKSSLLAFVGFCTQQKGQNGGEGFQTGKTFTKFIKFASYPVTDLLLSNLNFSCLFPLSCAFSLSFLKKEYVVIFLTQPYYQKYRVQLKLPPVFVFKKASSV